MQTIVSPGPVISLTETTATYLQDCSFCGKGQKEIQLYKLTYNGHKVSTLITCRECFIDLTAAQQEMVSYVKVQLAREEEEEEQKRLREEQEVNQAP